MLEASEFAKRRDDGKKLRNKKGHVVKPLGCFKNKSGERNLVIVLANRTAGGLEVRKWIDRVTALLLLEGREKEVGPALCGMDGFMLKQLTVHAEDGECRGACCYQ